MDWLSLRRYKQILTYGWKDSKAIALESGKSRMSVFADILSAYRQYHIFSNQYCSKELWRLTNEEERSQIATPIGIENFRRDNWVRENYRNWKFIRKWTNLKYELSPSLQQKRKKAYTREFNAGEGLIVQFNVHIHREHYLDGTIKIGKNVLLAKNVFIDYSGFLEIRDNVAFSDGVVIETHSHVAGAFALKGKGCLQQTHLIIEEGVSVGSKAMILETVTRIGRHARIGAGAVVRKNIPPYAVAIGNPAKVVGFVMTPEDVEEVEKNYPENERISMDQYRKDYEKYFKGRIKDIRKYVNN